MSRDQLILDNINLVYSVANGFKKRLPKNVCIEDLCSVGSIALIRAVDNYKEDKNAKLSTWATLKIKGAILDYLRTVDPLSRAQRDRVNKVKKVRKDNEDLTLKEIATKAELTMDEVIRADHDSFISKHTSLEDVNNFTGPLILYDLISRSELNESLNKLNEKERNVLYLMYFEGKLQTEIAKQLNCTKGYISQISVGAIKKLRESMRVE